MVDIRIGGPARPRAREGGVPWAARIARRGVDRAFASLDEGRLIVREAGRDRAFGHPAPDRLAATLTVLDPAFYPSVALRGTVGAGESYTRGEWATDDLVSLVRLFVRNRASMMRLERGAARVVLPWLRAIHARRRNSRRGSRGNIAAHYDLGNDFFALWLDPTMTYSAAYYPDATTTLAEAQVAKLDRICRKLALAPGDRVLEIGSGWGGFAIHAARHYGCRVTTTTISREQHDEATARVARAGLSDRVDVRLQDYRDLDGTYDKLVSIEMIEAVGHHYYDAFFRVLGERLAPHGSALVQAITIPDDHYARALREVDFIKHYIFPGSDIPSVAALTAAMARSSDLRLADFEDVTPHYVRTLADWRERFLARVDDVRAMGYPDAFLRQWLFYLAYCEGGFAERFIGTAHLVFTKPRSTLVVGRGGSDA